MKFYLHSGYHLAFLFVLMFATLFAKSQISSTASGGNWNSPGTWAGGVVPSSSDGVIIVNGATVNVDASLAAACASISINSGSGSGASALTFGSGSTLTVSGVVTVGGSGATTGSIDMSLGGALIAQQLVVSTAGTWAPGIGTVQLTATNTLPNSFFSSFNNLTISAGITTTAAGLSFSGILTVSTGAAWSNPGNFAMTFMGGIASSGTFTAGTGVHTFSTNDQALNGNLSIPNVTVTGITLTNNDTLTVATALSGTGTLSQANNATLNIGGTSAITALTATNTGNTVQFTGGSQTINSNNYYHLTLSGSGTDVLQTGTTSITGNLTFFTDYNISITAVTGLTIGGDFVLNYGITFTAGSFTHNVGGKWINNSSSSPPGFVGGTGAINFNGSAPQIIGGGTPTMFTNLTINNPTSVSLYDTGYERNIGVTGILTLSQGYLISGCCNTISACCGEVESVDLLFLTSGATVSVANAVDGVPQYNSPFVYGPITKYGNQAFIFPVGVPGTGCVPIGISAPASVTDEVVVQYFRSSAKALGSITAPNLYNVSNCDFWVADIPSGLDVTAYWNANSPCNGEAPGGYVTDLATIALAHFNGTNWHSSTPIPAMTTGNTITGSVTWPAAPAPTFFALGNNNISQDNPLAIKLDYFTATKANGYNILSWKAECTTSLNLFEVERSYDGAGFNAIDTVKADAASDCSQAFVYNDHSASGDKIYYRIKTTDAGGNVDFSDIKFISNLAATFEMISVSPNPVSGQGATLTISSVKNDEVELVILSIDGREVQRRTVQAPIGASTLHLRTSGLSKGMYIVKGIFSGGQTNTIKFMKQ